MTSGELTIIPSLGFIRGAIVRWHGQPPNMMVVRGLGETTAVVVCEGVDATALRLREYPTSELRAVVPGGFVRPPVPPRAGGSARRSCRVNSATSAESGGCLIWRDAYGGVSLPWLSLVQRVRGPVQDRGFVLGQVTFDRGQYEVEVS